MNPAAVSSSAKRLLCAEISRSRGEALAGTAAHAPVVIAVEERGAWAPKAIESGGLDAIRASLESWVAKLGARLQLIRRPDRCEGPRRVYVCTPGTAGTLQQLELEDAQFESVDLEAALSQAPHANPIHLVCVHGKRDRCCALEGGAYFRAHDTNEQVWMTSHLGGHRFAATTLTLPNGLCHGHLNADHAKVSFHDLPVTKLRGRVSYSAPVQAAEASLLLSQPDQKLTLDDVSEVSATEVRVRFRNNDASFEILVRKVVHAPHVLSCGDVAKASATWTVEAAP